MNWSRSQHFGNSRERNDHISKKGSTNCKRGPWMLAWQTKKLMVSNKQRQTSRIVHPLMISGKESFIVQLGNNWYAIEFGRSTHFVHQPSLKDNKSPSRLRWDIFNWHKNICFFDEASIVPLKQLGDCFAYMVQRVAGKWKVKLRVRSFIYAEKKKSTRMVQVTWHLSS